MQLVVADAQPQPSPPRKRSGFVNFLPTNQIAVEASAFLFAVTRYCELNVMEFQREPNLPGSLPAGR